MQQKKLHNNNSKESITCYKCNQKNHIKKNAQFLSLKNYIQKQKTWYHTKNSTMLNPIMLKHLTWFTQYLS